jgi:hypothetical protein
MDRNQGLAVDIETRRQKQQELMVRIVERKVRERAQQLYEERGQEDGWALQDWFQAESEVLENSAIAVVYRRLKSIVQGQSATDADYPGDFSDRDAEICESPA